MKCSPLAAPRNSYRSVNTTFPHPTHSLFFPHLTPVHHSLAIFAFGKLLQCIHLILLFWENEMSEKQKRESVWNSANRKPGSKDSLRASHSQVPCVQKLQIVTSTWKLTFDFCNRRHTIIRPPALSLSPLLWLFVIALQFHFIIL